MIVNNKLEYEIHERVLLFLYNRRHSGDMSDLLVEFKDVDERILFAHASDLYKKGLIEIQYPFPGFLTIDPNTGETERHAVSTENYIKGKILIDGIIYVKKSLLNKKSNTKAARFLRFAKKIANGVLIGTLIAVVVYLIVYYLFGIKP